MKGAITVFMTLLFGMILSLVLVTIENVRFLTGESYARLSAKGALHAVFGEYNRELYEDYGVFGYGGYSQKNQDELSRNIERQLQTALGQQDKAASSANIDLYRIHDISCTIADIKSVADREELYRQIKADNALLRELKTTVKKLMQAVKASGPALAEAMESLRANMVIFCYQIRYAGFGKHKLSESLNVLKPDLERYSVLVQQIKNKTKERKTLLAEKKATPFYQFVAHNDLAKQIAELTEDLEELRSEKTMLLSSFDCSEDTGIAEVKKSVSAMEENLKRLTKQEEKYAAELEDALKQFSELREQAKNVDSAELSEQRIVLQGEKIQSATSKIKAAYGEKFDPLILFDSKRDVSELLGEKTEARSIQEHLKQKQQPEKQQKKAKYKEQER